MTTKTDIVNHALQVIGTRTTITDADLAGNLNNEAKQANLIYDTIRQDLIRMAPWDCAFNTVNMVYITSAQGTPENVSPATSLWQKGLPAPPWAYEYQYPVDCLRACWVVPQFATGFAGGVPITTAVTGGAPSFWSGQPVRFKVGIDQFYPVTAAAVTAGGAGHNVGDIITLPLGPNTANPIGAPVQLLVTAAPGGVISGVSVITVLNGETGVGGSYFHPQSGAIAQGSTTGTGTGATFTLTFGPQGDQRVILTNQEFGILNYCRDVVDVNVFDPLFRRAFEKILGARICIALTGDKTLANLAIQDSNATIEEARKVDGNEGLTINDTTPDWIRIRGIYYTEGLSGPYGSGYDWGSLWPTF